MEMGQSKINDNNYYQVSGWMLNRLKLKGASLNIFAIIYGFSQDGESEFTGSRQYLADFINATRPTVDKALNELCEKDYINKTQKVINNVTFNTYKANLEVVNILCMGSKETLQGGKETLQGGSKETLPNNKYTNNKDHNKDYKEERKKDGTTYDTILSNSSLSSEVKETFYEFIKMRKLIKKPLTDFALKKMIKKLNTLSTDASEQVKILEKSILNNWQDIYAPKDEQVSQKAEPKNDGLNYHKFDVSDEKTMTAEELAELDRKLNEGSNENKWGFKF